jgi:N-dimethylarginine dimethylaminohydrolase
MWSTPRSETGRLLQLVVKHASDAFVTDDAIAAEWQALNFTAPPDRVAAIREYDRFLELLSSTGTEVHMLPVRGDVGLDSIYVRDASLVTPHGMLLCRMGKPLRRGEPRAQGDAFEAWGLPVVGAIEAPGTIEGGDVVWLDDTTVAVGHGYRTNAEGIRQFRACLGDAIEMIVVPLPHWRGHGDVFHLMSMISPIDRDLAVVYSPLLPVPFREALLARGIELVEVPEGEFDSMGANVLAIGPRRCLAVDGNPQTRARLEREGVEVLVYEGEEISVKGGGGPTCLTRPIRRGA